MKTVLLLETPCMDRVPTPPDAGEAYRRRENRSMEDNEQEAARVEAAAARACIFAQLNGGYSRCARSM
jgi:hypothetical protein